MTATGVTQKCIWESIRRIAAYRFSLSAFWYGRLFLLWVMYISAYMPLNEKSSMNWGKLLFDMPAEIEAMFEGQLAADDLG